MGPDKTPVAVSLIKRAVFISFHYSLIVFLIQKRVVNVYRLITRGTLEEKIMGLQKFKMNIANTVISQENSSLQSMGTDQLLDLFTLDKVRSSRSFTQFWWLSARAQAL